MRFLGGKLTILYYYTSQQLDGSNTGKSTSNLLSCMVQSKPKVCKVHFTLFTLKQFDSDISESIKLTINNSL